MPFIGTTPTQGFVSSFPKQSFTPNGSTTVFTLTNPVATANDLEVFVGNVRQEPTTAYTAAGTTLTMSEAPASGLNFYVINKSFAQVTTNPPDGSVSTAKLDSNAVTTAKIANDAITDVKLATDSVGADALGTGVVGTTQLAASAVTSAKIDNNSTLSYTKLANLDQASNTATSFTFHSVLNQSYQVYRILGYLGGTVSTGNANLNVRFVTGTGDVVTANNYYSGSAGFLSDNNWNYGFGNPAQQGNLLLASSTGTSIYFDMTIVPNNRWLYGWCYTHDQNTHIGVTTYAVRYNAGIANWSGLHFRNSGNDNLTAVDATIYGAHTDGSMGG